MNCNRASFPTVATVIGLSPESLGNSRDFVATIAVDPSTIMSNPISRERNMPPAIKSDDPITQALVDNINGSLPLKKEPEVFRCEMCNVSVSKQVVLDAHLVGLKHSKKLKSLELLQELGSAVTEKVTSGNHTRPNTFSCRVCGISVNSSHQLHAHMQGAKHKAKALTSQSNTTYVPAAKVGFPVGAQGTHGNDMVGIDVSANRLYCAACNIHVNSDIQLHQHITSNKHLDKVNGKSQQQHPRAQQRNAPYQRPPGKMNFTQYSNTPHINHNFVSAGNFQHYRC